MDTTVFVFCVEALIYLLLNNLHDCTFQVHLSLDFKKQYSDNKSLVDGNTLKVKVASDIYVKKKEQKPMLLVVSRTSTLVLSTHFTECPIEKSGA